MHTLNYVCEKYPIIFKSSGKKTKMSGIGLKGLIYELSESGFGTYEFIKNMPMYEFFDIVKYLRLKAETIKDQKNV